jgi:type IV pilus assembly protein PilM
MKKHLPFPVETAQIDFLILGESAEKDLKKLDLVAVACPKHLINRFLAIAEGAGLKPIHLNVAPFALWNTLLVLDQFEKEKVVALIDLGAEKTGICIFKDGFLQFSREVSPAGGDMTRAMMEGMDSAENPDLVYEQAERIKKTMGIPPKDFYKKTSDQSTHLPKIPFLVRPVLEKLIGEISRSLNYYRNQFHVGKVDRFLLTGGGAHLSHIDTYLVDELRLPIERFDPFKEMLFDARKIAPERLYQMGAACMIALGVALPERYPTELLPAKEPYWSRVRVEKNLPGFSLLLTFLVFALIVWNTSGELSRVQKERDEKMAKVKAIETFQAKLKTLKEKEIQIKENLSIFPPSMIVPVPFREVLGTVSHTVPNNVTVTLLSMPEKPKSAKEEPQTDETRELHINGLAFGNDLHCLTALAQIIEGLEKSPLFKNVELVSAGENKSYNRPGVQFEIVCDLELENPPSSPLDKGGRGRPEPDYGAGRLGDVEGKTGNP